MAISSSTFAVSAPQADGRVWITETHVNGTGAVITIAYLAANDDNAQAVMAARVAGLNTMLADSEFEFWVTQDAPIVAITPLNQQTTAEFAVRLVARFHAAEKLERARLAAWVLNRIEAGIYTDNQVRNAFGYSAGVWTTYKAKMTTLREAWDEINAAVGE